MSRLSLGTHQDRFRRLAAGFRAWLARRSYFGDGAWRSENRSRGLLGQRWRYDELRGHMEYPDRFGVTDKDVDLRLEAERLQDTLKGQPVARMKRQRNPGSVAALPQFLPDSAVAPSGLLG